MNEVYHIVQLPLFVLSKICIFCNPPTEKPIECFGTNKGFRDGHNNHCKECVNERERAKYATNIENERARSRAKDRNMTRASNHKCYIKNGKNRTAKARERYATDTEWREYNLTRTHIYSATHPEIKKATSRAYYVTHKSEAKEKDMRRNAIKKGSAVGKVNYDLILEQYGRWCHICEKEILPDQKLEFDHVIPLAKNGPHITENIKPSHRTCNRRKWDKLMEELTDWDRSGI